MTAQKGKHKILITSALPYVNNVPHLGNIVGCVLSADVYARYCRSRGYETLYICGTDEYGTATEIKAIEEGLTPQQICDKYHKIHAAIYSWFGINFDYFGRTSTPKHTEIVQHLFSKLNEEGFIAEEEIEQLYDEKAGMFLADRYVEGACPHCGYGGARGDQCDGCGRVLRPDELINPVSRISKTAPVKRKTRHLFIDLPKIEPRLREWIAEASVAGKWNENAKAITESWLKEGLKRRAITRDLKWGVPVPLKGFEDKVFYVWFDAPIGYISITANFTEKWRDWWMAKGENVRLYQFMGKDNVLFHTVIFPSTLLGSGEEWTLLHHLSTTEFLNYEGGKFSKSKNIGVFGNDAMESGIPADVWRYYLLRNRPEKADTDFVWEDFADKTNNELIANLGNLVNRTISFIANNYGGEVPEGQLSEKDLEFAGEQRKIIAEIGSCLENVQIKDGLLRVLEFGKNANRYFQENRPWELVKTDKACAATVIFVLANQVKDLAIICEPYLPHTSAGIFAQLGISPRKWEDAGLLTLKGGTKTGKPAILFRKIEEKQAKALREKFSGKGSPLAEKEISFADLDLEVGEILSVEKHPDAEKLYVEIVQLGDRKAQIVSGLAPHIPKEELAGKRIIVVKNLEPAKLRGVESQGMLLAAESADGKVEVLFTDAAVGSKALHKGERPSHRGKRKIGIKEFAKIRMEIRNHEFLAEGKPVFAGETAIRAKMKEGKVR
ncbi:MAG: methionine--tRNA ligase [Candidatus Bilamarchaeaceae archaeon]